MSTDDQNIALAARVAALESILEAVRRYPYLPQGLAALMERLSAENGTNLPLALKK